MNRTKRIATSSTRRTLVATVGAGLALAAAVPAGVASGTTVPAHAAVTANGAAHRAFLSTGVVITAPSAIGVVTGKSVRVSLRTGTAVTGIKAYIGTTNISGMLRRHGQSWSGDVPVARVGNGTQKLIVRALTKHGDGGTDSVTFVVGHTVRGLLTNVQTHNVDSSAVTINARTARATTATLTLNGVPVADINDPGSSSTHSWRLTKISGLRSGVNRASLVVQDQHGGLATKSWTFKHTLGSGRLGADEAPALGAQGLYVSTDLQSVDGGNNYNTMSVADTAYTSTLSIGSAIIVQLDAATLAPVASSLDGTGVAPKAGTVTIAVWKDHDVSFAGTPNGSRMWIGTREVADNESHYDCNPYGNCNTNLHGWLEPAAGVNPATWTDSDMLTVQTRRADDGATSNTMTIGGTSYPVSLSSGATGGFELLTLNNIGQPTDPATAYSFVGDPSADAATVSSLATALTKAIDDGHVTVMLQGFGKLPQLAGTGPLAQAITTLGGNADVLSHMGTASGPSDQEYALIGARYTDPNKAAALPYGWLGQEASKERSGDGTLASLLVRDQTQNDYVPMTTTAAGDGQIEGDNDLMKVVYQTPSSWKAWIPDGSGGLRTPTAAEQAAFNDIQGALVDPSGSLIPSDPAKFLCPAAPDPIRGALCNTNTSVLLSDALNVSGLSFNAGQGSAGGYTAADFATVQSAVKTEFENASIIYTTIEDYQNIFGNATESAIVQTGTIGDDILKNLPTSGATIDTDVANVLTMMTNVVTAFGPAAPEIRYFSSGLKLMGMFQADSGPGVQVGGTERVTQDTAAATLATNLNDASTQFAVYGDFLASDPMKLMQGAHLLGTEYSLSGNHEGDVERATAYGVNQYLWGTLMAPVYTVWTGPSSLGNPLSCLNTEWPGSGWADPFSNSDQNAFWAGVGTVSWIGAITDPNNFGSYSKKGVAQKYGLPAATADQLSQAINPKIPPTSSTNVGVVEPYFENTYLTKTNLPIWDQYSGNLVGCKAQS